MDIQIKDIEKLAKLARIEITDQEKEDFRKDLGSIFGYISEINEVNLDQAPNNSNDHANVFRDDVVTNSAGQYTESILGNAPVTKDALIQVNQVL